MRVGDPCLRATEVRIRDYRDALTGRQRVQYPRPQAAVLDAGKRTTAHLTSGTLYEVTPEPPKPADRIRSLGDQ